MWDWWSQCEQHFRHQGVMHKSRPHFLVFILLIVAVYFAWDRWPSLLRDDLATFKDLDKHGQFGDSFGALNALFTGLAFAGVAFTIYLQLSDASEREHEKANEQFETRFFQLTDSLRSVVNAMATRGFPPESTKSGKDVFGAYLKEQGSIELPPAKYPVADKAARLIARYERIYEWRQDDLGPYFRMLYHIIRFVDRSKIENKEDYTDLVRAELSSSELCLLAVNCLTDKGKKFKPLVERYHLLKHLPEDSGDTTRSVVLPLYDATAFNG